LNLSIDSNDSPATPPKISLLSIGSNSPNSPRSSVLKIEDGLRPFSIADLEDSPTASDESSPVIAANDDKTSSFEQWVARNVKNDEDDQ
jgi:hypothetical protein